MLLHLTCLLDRLFVNNNKVASIDHCLLLVFHSVQVPLIVIHVQLDTSALELSYLTHALQDSTVPQEPAMILNPVLWEPSATTLVWPLRVNAHSVLEVSIVRQLAERQ